MANVQHSTQSGVELHEDKRIKEPVRAASTANVSLTVPGAALDGVSLASGYRILLKDQSVPNQNGIYVWSGAASPLARSDDLDSSADFTLGHMAYVVAGTINGSTMWLYNTTTVPVVVGSTSLSYVSMGATGPVGATGATGAQGPTGSMGPIGISSFTLTDAPLYVCAQDVKTTGVVAGGFTNGAYQTRTLNTLAANDQGIASLASNRITLPAGTWRVLAHVPAFDVDRHRARLQGITPAGTLLLGQGAFAPVASVSMSSAVIAGRIALRETTTMEVQHRCQTTRASDGMGTPMSFGDTEVYTIIEFWLEGGAPPFFYTPPPSQQYDVIRWRQGWASGGGA